MKNITNFKQNNIFISNDFLTNFKPNSAIILKNISFFKKKKHEIFCKNFFLFIILIKYSKKNIKNTSNFCTFNRLNFFVKPLKKKLYTILRSPYRHKLARQQFYILRYSIKLSIKIKIKPFFLKNFKELLNIFLKFKKIGSFIETNILYNHKKFFSFNFTFDKNFKIKMFNNK